MKHVHVSRWCAVLLARICSYQCDIYFSCSHFGLKWHPPRILQILLAAHGHSVQSSPVQTSDLEKSKDKQWCSTSWSTCFCFGQTVCTRGTPGLPSVLSATDSNVDFNSGIGDDFNYGKGDASFSILQQRGVDALSRALASFNENVDNSGDSSFLEFIQQNGHDLPGDAFSISAESFEEPGDGGLEFEPSPADAVSEAVAFEPQQVPSFALQGGSFGDVVESGPQCDFLDVDLDACFSTALMSLPFMVPEPIWEERVWSANFGNGILIKTDFCDLDLCKPAQAPFLDSWIEQIATCSWVLKQSVSEIACDNYSDVVKHMTDQTWEEERESLLQSALKGWMMVVTLFKQTTVVWVQLATESSSNLSGTTVHRHPGWKVTLKLWLFVCTFFPWRNCSQ